MSGTMFRRRQKEINLFSTLKWSNHHDELYNFAFSDLSRTLQKSKEGYAYNFFLSVSLTDEEFIEAFDGLVQGDIVGYNNFCYSIMCSPVIIVPRKILVRIYEDLSAHKDRFGFESTDAFIYKEIMGILDNEPEFWEILARAEGIEEELPVEWLRELL